MPKRLTLPKELETLVEQKQELQEQIEAVDGQIREQYEALGEQLGLSGSDGAEPVEEVAVEKAPTPKPRAQRNARPKPARPSPSGLPRAKPVPREAIVECVRRTGPRATLGAIRNRLQVAGYEMGDGALSVALGAAVKRGEVMRTANGVYCTPEQLGDEPRPPTGPVLAPTG